MTTPFIKKFTLDGVRCIYDVNTNQVVEVEDSVYHLIDDYREGEEKGFEEIADARERHELFPAFRPEILRARPVNE